MRNQRSISYINQKQTYRYLLNSDYLFGMCFIGKVESLSSTPPMGYLPPSRTFLIGPRGTIFLWNSSKVSNFKLSKTELSGIGMKNELNIF